MLNPEVSVLRIPLIQANKLRAVVFEKQIDLVDGTRRVVDIDAGSRQFVGGHPDARFITSALSVSEDAIRKLAKSIGVAVL